jgi:hypothetical protein
MNAELEITLRDEFEDLWPIPNNVIFDELTQEYRWRDYPNTTPPVNDMWESFCDGARVQQKRVEELEEALVPVDSIPAERVDRHASERAGIYNRGWNDCRKAMLAASQEQGK